MGRQKYRAFLN